MKSWTLSLAKNQFSRLAELAVRRGPQRVTRGGKPSIVVIAETDLDRLTPGSAGEFFKEHPLSDELAEVLQKLEA